MSQQYRAIHSYWHKG